MLWRAFRRRAALFKSASGKFKHSFGCPFRCRVGKRNGTTWFCLQLTPANDVRGAVVDLRDV